MGRKKQQPAKDEKLLSAISSNQLSREDAEKAGLLPEWEAQQAKNAAAEENKKAVVKPQTDYQKHQESWKSKREAEAERSSSVNPDYLNHPKFAKFKKSSGVKQHD